MDLFDIILIVFVILLLVSVCGWCGKKNSRGTFTTVTVPGQVITQNIPYPQQETIISTNQSVHMPYPTPMQHPASMPQPYTVTYPVHNAAQGPYPPAHPPYPTMPQPYSAAGLPQGNFYPYPPAMAAASQQNPPTYDEATGVYAKQSAYNPNCN